MSSAAFIHKAKIGNSFNVKDKRKLQKGLGLTGMKERAALIGGTLEIESAPGQGTTVYIRIQASAIRERKL